MACSIILLLLLLLMLLLLCRLHCALLLLPRAAAVSCCCCCWGSLTSMMIIGTSLNMSAVVRVSCLRSRLQQQGSRPGQADRAMHSKVIRPWAGIDKQPYLTRGFMVQSSSYADCTLATPKAFAGQGLHSAAQLHPLRHLVNLNSCNTASAASVTAPARTVLLLPLLLTV